MIGNEMLGKTTTGLFVLVLSRSYLVPFLHIVLLAPFEDPERGSRSDKKFE
jgi:hypothetical protein